MRMMVSPRPLGGVRPLRKARTARGCLRRALAACDPRHTPGFVSTALAPCRHRGQRRDLHQRQELEAGDVAEVGEIEAPRHQIRLTDDCLGAAA
jgi:hypothetical protein